MLGSTWLRRCIAATAVLFSVTAGAQSRDMRSVARNLVQAGMVKQGDKVLINGSVRDAALLEDIALEVMKVGAHPLITLSSDRLLRRSYDEVPARFDNATSPVGKLLVEEFDVQINLDVGENEGVLAGVPMARRSARNKAGEPITDAFFKRRVRSVNLGNGLYPTATLSRRLGVNQSDLAAAFWRASAVSPASMRTRANSMRQVFAKGQVITLTAPNGTNISFRVDADRALISDGALTEERVRQGSAAASTWLPAGELMLPAANGTANGKIVLDRYLFDGRLIRGLTLVFDKGSLTSMTAANDMSGLKAAYDAAGGAKDRFGYIDIGLNPETRLPVGSGRIVWTAPGSVVIGVGDNRGFGGNNTSDFGMAAQLSGATVTVDGTAVVANGRLR
ncbi:MAG TPA: aminopeptidase [Gemmatimonadaceae bacterium]|nr:aminopeptidase [Gemmatimonadaceae bacterium]